MRIFLALMFVWFCSASVVTAEEIVGKVVSVIDGNTFELQVEGDLYEIILYGIDCPDLGQPYAEEAKVLLEKIILKKTLTVTIEGKNRYGVRMGTLLVKNKIDPRNDLLENGLAWTAERNALEDLEKLRQNARDRKVGIWTQEDPVPPWIYRRTQSMLRPKSS